jgi:molybdopterin synthase catalytic subunit
MRTSIRVQAQDFDIASETESLSDSATDIGAIATFTGLVRSDDGLSAMTLEHYPGMTEHEIARHVAEAAARWPLRGVTIIHRVGRLLPGERIVLVAVASSHRAAAFEACAFLMDYLKTRAPFWKQEERAGASMWVEAKRSDDQAAQRWETT